MFNVLESEIMTLILSQNYDSNISRQLLTSLTILSILWSSAPLTEEMISCSIFRTFPMKVDLRMIHLIIKVKIFNLLTNWIEKLLYLR